MGRVARLGTVMWTTVDIMSPAALASTERTRAGHLPVHGWGKPARSASSMTWSFAGHPQSTALTTTTISYKTPVDGKAFL
jgi:hypothetical protein